MVGAGAASAGPLGSSSDHRQRRDTRPTTREADWLTSSADSPDHAGRRRQRRGVTTPAASPKTSTEGEVMSVRQPSAESLPPP